MYIKNKLICVIDSVMYSYDACSSGDLDDAKAFYYGKFIYIGSNNGLSYVNGVKNDFKHKYHFFIRMNKQEIRNLKLKNLNESI